MDASKELSFFDHFADEHGEYDVLGERAYRRLLGVFNALVSPRKGEHCLDLGCGSGAFTRRLSAFGLVLTGMDISPRSIEAAVRLSASETYQIGDIRATGFATGQADIVVYSGVLHHCDRGMTRVEILREGYRLLKPGGRVFAFDPSAHSPSMWLYRDPRSPFYSSRGKTENEVLLTRGQLLSEFQEAGFSRIFIRGVSGISFSYVAGPLARLLLPLYNFYEEIVRFSPFERQLGTFLVSAAAKN